MCFPFGNNGPNAGVCDTCGSIPETNGYKCENGGTCNGLDGGCL